MIDKEQFFSITRDAPVAVEIKNLGTLYVASMTAKQRDAFEVDHLEKMDTGQDKTNFRARLVVQCTVDENGARFFCDDDVENVGDMPISVIQPLFNVASSLNGFSDKDIEELAGN